MALPRKEVRNAERIRPILPKMYELDEREYSIIYIYMKIRYTHTHKK